MKVPDGKTITITFVSQQVKDHALRWAVDVTFPGGAGPEAGKPGKGKTKRAAGAKKQNAFSARLKESLKAYFQNPLKLLPGIVLTLIWIVFSLLGNLGSSSPVMKVLNTLTYSSGGMYGGPMGAAGGIFGKAVFAAVLNTIVLSLWKGKNPFSPDAQGQSLMRKATTSGMATVAPFIIGLGASLVLYYIFNVTGSTTNVMVGVVAAIGAVQAAQSSHGIIFSIVLFIASKVSGGRAPSSSTVRFS